MIKKFWMSLFFVWLVMTIIGSGVFYFLIYPNIPEFIPWMLVFIPYIIVAAVLCYRWWDAIFSSETFHKLLNED